jgi:hypothetical protein
MIAHYSAISYWRSFGPKKVDAAGGRHVEAIQVTTKDRPYQANSVLSLLSKMFNLIVEVPTRSVSNSSSIGLRIAKEIELRSSVLAEIPPRAGFIRGWDNDLTSGSARHHAKFTVTFDQSPA